MIYWTLKTLVRHYFVYFRSVSLHKVVEVREGQQTDMFDKFPYEQVKEQSFSLMYMKEGGQLAQSCMLYTRQSFQLCKCKVLTNLISDKRYAYLTSLNLICDHPQNYDIWINEVWYIIRYGDTCIVNLLCMLAQLKSKVEERQHSGDHLVSNQENDTTDTTILYPFISNFLHE